MINIIFISKNAKKNIKFGIKNDQTNLMIITLMKPKTPY